MRELLFLLPVAYGLADSFAGGSLGAKAKALDDKLPGRGPFWAMLVLAGLGYLAAGFPASVVAVFWWGYRIVKPKQFGGSATPVTAREILGSVLLHSLSLAAMIGAIMAHRPLLQSLGFLVAYVFVAVGLAVMYGDHKKDAIAAGEAIEADDPFNTKVELARGAMFGAVIAWTLLI